MPRGVQRVLRGLRGHTLIKHIVRRVERGAGRATDVSCLNLLQIAPTAREDGPQRLVRRAPRQGPALLEGREDRGQHLSITDRRVGLDATARGLQELRAARVVVTGSGQRFDDIPAKRRVAHAREGGGARGTANT